MTSSERHHVLLGLIGDGIGRSLAPLLHQREADRQGIRLLYTIIDSHTSPLTAGDLPDLLRWARRLGYRGLNVTHPFKQEILPHLDELSAEAHAVGAVNTVVFEADRTRGYNTDWSGFRRAFERDFPTAPRESVVQLGAGGAGSAVAHAMLTLGVGRLTIIDLVADRARGLADSLAAQFGPDRITTGLITELGPLLASAEGLVNTTPIGMAQHPGTPVPATHLRKDLWVADIVYRPTDTALLQAARTVGAPTLHGGGMNTFQAVAAFEHFTGRPADIAAMAADTAELLLLDL